MIPPLKPRPQRRGQENDLPSKLNVSLSSSPSISFTSTQGRPLSKHDATERGRIFTQGDHHRGSKKIMQSAPLSPPASMNASATQEHHDRLWQTPKQQVQQDALVGQHHKHLLVDYSYSSASSMDSSMSSSMANGTSPLDLTLTPPQATTTIQHSSLMVAAKRHGNELRDANNSESRRRRRRRRLSKDAEVTSVLVQATSGNTGNRTPAIASKNLASFDDDDEDEYTWWNESKEDDESSEDDAPMEFLTGQAALMSPEERTRKYWEWCYGDASSSAVSQTISGIATTTRGVTSSFSAKRVPPLKGCLSNPRPRRPATSQFSTPSESPEEDLERKRQAAERAKRGFRVQFGSPSAVEYNIDACPRQLTPMPDQRVKDQYSMTPVEATEEEEEMTIETKHNNAILSEWEDMDHHIDTKSQHKRGGKGSGRKRNRKSRRESSIFSPSVDWAQRSNEENGNDVRSCGSCEVERQSLEQNGIEKAKSPSTLIANNLASLQMSPVSHLNENDLQDPQDSFVVSHNIDSEEVTWDFAVNLGSIHSSGAACASMDASFDSINPLDAMTNSTLSSFQQEAPSPENMKAFHDPERVVNEFCSDVTGIAKNIFENPQSDQQHEIIPVLHHVAFFQRSDYATLETGLRGMHPLFENAISCLDTFIEGLHSAESSNAKYVTEERAREVALVEWKRIECLLATDLTKMMQELNHRLSGCHFLHDATTKPTTSAGLRLEIHQLEHEIQQEVDEVALLDAALAPTSLAFGEATSWASLLGFNLEHGDDGEFVLKWNHLERADTTVVFPLDASAKLIIASTAVSSKTDSLAIDKLYRSCLNFVRMVVSEMSGIDESLLVLSRWLSRLDGIATALQNLPNAVGATVSPLEESVVLLSFNAMGKMVRVALGLTHLSVQGVSFETDEGSLSIQETKEYNGVPLPDTIGRILQRFLGIA